MVNPDLQKYIDDARAIGKNDEEIRGSLLSSGWNEAQVNEAFAAPKETPDSPPPASSTAEPSAPATPNLTVKKKNLVLLVGGIVLVMLIIGAVVAYFLIQKASVPTFG